MKFWIVNIFMLFALLLNSCVGEFEEESTVVLTEGVFDPIKVTINNKIASSFYNYGDYEKGVEAIPLIYKIKNNSQHPIKDIKIEFEDLDITEFNFTVNEDNEFAFPGRNGTCGKVLPPGESCTIDIQFFSDKTFKYNQTITLSYDNVVFPNSIKTSFFVNSGSPAVLIYEGEKTIYKYGDLVGPSKIAVVERALALRQVKNLTITNTGELTAKAINFEEEPSCTSTSTNDCPAGHENAFEYETNCPQKLAPGASCNIDVYFQPLNKDPEVGEIADNLKEIEYRTFIKTNYINGPRNNPSSLQGSFSSLSTRIQANFTASSENLIFPNEITVGNRLTQSFKISNVGYRSGYLNIIDSIANSDEEHKGTCTQSDNDAWLDCLQTDLSGPMERIKQPFFIKDVNGCFSSDTGNVFIEVGQSCLFTVLFQPSTDILAKNRLFNRRLELTYDSLFQGEETLIRKELINLVAESKSKAKLDLKEIEIGSFVNPIADNTEVQNSGYDLTMGRLAIESPNYYRRKSLLIRIKNTGSTKANNIVIMDGNLDVIPSVVEPPFKINLGANKDDDKTFFKDVSKSDNCTNLPPQAVCTVSIRFAPIGFSDDDAVVDANFFDSTFNGEPRKSFVISWDSQSKFTDDNIDSEAEDYSTESYFVFIDATLVRKAKMANVMDINEDLVEWKGNNNLEHKGDAFVSGNEPEYTIVYRNIGTGPASYIYSPIEPFHKTPKLDAEEYELIPTTDLAAHNAQHDCLDIIDFGFEATGADATDAADANARSGDWDPLPKEEACALTYKLTPTMEDYVTLAPNALFDSTVFTGLNWMARGFDDLGDPRDVFHFRDTPVGIDAGLYYADGDNTDPLIDPGNSLESAFGNIDPILSSYSIPYDHPASVMGEINFRRELKAQIRPLFTRPAASSVLWRKGQTYEDPVPGWYAANELAGLNVEWTTWSFFTAPAKIEIEDTYWLSSHLLDYGRSLDPDEHYLNIKGRPTPSATITARRTDAAYGLFTSGRSWRSPDYVDAILDPHKDNYPIIIHIGSYPINHDSHYMIGYGNAAIGEADKNGYSYRVEHSESGDGVFTNYYADEKIATAEGLNDSNEGSKLGNNLIPFYYYVGKFRPTAAGVFTNEITVKYKDGITDNLKLDGNLRELEYKVLIIGEGVADPPNLEIDIQDYTVTPQEGASPIEAINGAPTAAVLDENDVFESQEVNEIKFEYVKNGEIDTESPYEKKVLTLRNTSTSTPLEELFFLNKDTIFDLYNSHKNLANAGVHLDITSCEPFFLGMPMAAAGLPNDRCEIIITYQPDLSDTEFSQYFQFGYEIKENQFSHRGVVVAFKPVDPALIKTELDKNSFRNLSGNLVPNASTLEVGTVSMSSAVVTRNFTDIRLFNETETPASLLNEYHQYLMDNNLKGYSSGSPPPIEFLPPAGDYSLRGSYNMTLFKKITYGDGSDKFLVFGTESCFIGDDEYPAAEDHYLEGFHSESGDCYIAIEANFNKEYIGRKINFSDGATTNGSYFSLNYYNNERLNISNAPIYFVFNGTFNPDGTTANGDIFNVQSNYHSKSIQFEFNPLDEVNASMGDIVGYRIFYSTSKNSVANVLYTTIVPDYVDIRDNLESPQLSLTDLDRATYYYFKIYPIRYYEPRDSAFLNPSFENLDTGEYLSISNLSTHRIVVPSETTSFNYAAQMLIKKSYVSASRVTFSDAIINCGVSSDTFKKDGISSLLTFQLINEDAWDVIYDNPLYTSYPSGNIQSLPHWIDTAPIDVDTAFASVTGYDSEEVSQAFSSDQLFYLRNESNFNGSVQRLEGGGPSPVSTNYTNYVTPGIPFGVARCYIDTSN